MKRTKEFHHVWVEWNHIPKELRTRLFMKKSLIGKWHYHYENKNGIIGLIKIATLSFDLSFKIDYRYMWEACGVLEFRRFRTKKEAEIEIYKALKESISLE